MVLAQAWHRDTTCVPRKNWREKPSFRCSKVAAGTPMPHRRTAATGIPITRAELQKNQRVRAPRSPPVPPNTTVRAAQGLATRARNESRRKTPVRASVLPITPAEPLVQTTCRNAGTAPMFAPGRLALTDWRISVSASDRYSAGGRRCPPFTGGSSTIECTGASLVKREKPLPDVHPRTVAQGNAGDFLVKYQAVSLPRPLRVGFGRFRDGK